MARAHGLSLTHTQFRQFQNKLNIGNVILRRYCGDVPRKLIHIPYAQTSGENDATSLIALKECGTRRNLMSSFCTYSCNTKHIGVVWQILPGHLMQNYVILQAAHLQLS